MTSHTIRCTQTSLGPGAELLPQATEIDTEKVWKIDAKRVENEAKMDAKVNDFSYFFEKGENARNHCIYKLKRGSGHVKSDEKSV